MLVLVTFIANNQKVSTVYRSKIKTILNISSQLYPLILLISLGFIWGSGYTLARFVISAHVPPLAYSFWQSLGPVALLLLYMASRKEYYRPNWRHIITGLFGIAIPNTNMYYAAQHTQAGMLAVLVNTVPLFTFIFALLCKSIRFDWKQALIVSLGLFGILFILNPTFSLSQLHFGNYLVLITPASFALTALFINQFCMQEHNTNLACGMLLTASLMILPIMLFENAFYFPTTALKAHDYAILLEILLSTLGYLIFFELLKVADAIYYSFVGGIVAVTGLFWGSLILKESLQPEQTVGTIIVVTAVSLINHYQGKKSDGKLQSNL